MGVHISIGGPNRSGKTTLAKSIAKWLELRGILCGLIDVDEIRVSTFGNDEPKLGDLDLTTSEGQAKAKLQKQMQGWTYNNVFRVQIPLVASCGAVPIFAATHSSLPAYDKAKAAAEKYGNKFLFFLLEGASFEEMCRRSVTDESSTSDMRGNIAENATQLANYEDINKRLADTYGPAFTGSYIHIPQGTPEEMTNIAMEHIAVALGISKPIKVIA